MRFFFLLTCLTISLRAQAQLPFSAIWSFDGNLNGVSNQPNISTGGIYVIGVNVPNVGPYTVGQSGQAVNVGGWSQTGGCNFSEFVEVVVQPLNAQKMTLTSLSFFINHSVNMTTGNTGPQSVRVRSSLDGYSNDLVQQAISPGFQTVNIGLNGSYANLTGSVTFHIYACPPNGGGTIRLDQLTFNGTVTNTPLPVTLLSFTAKANGDLVELAWSTTSERNADRFVVERSASLDEFIVVGEVAANGTTEVRQYYGLTDRQPLPGANYYRLKQIDTDGTLYLFKPVSVVVGTSALSVIVYPNPASPDRVHLRLRNASEGTVQLWTTTGQQVTGRIQWQSPDDVELIPAHPLPAGLYWLTVVTGVERQIRRLLVR